MDEELARGNLDMAELSLNEGQAKVALSYADTTYRMTIDI